MKGLDRTTLITLGFIFLVIVYMTLSYDPESAALILEEQSRYSSEVAFVPIPHLKDSVIYPVIVSYDGEVIVQGLDGVRVTDFSQEPYFDNFKAGYIETQANSWIHYRFNSKLQMTGYSNSEVTISQNEITLNNGKIRLVSNNTDAYNIVSRDVKITFPTRESVPTDVVITSEPGKVRVFVLSGSVSLEAASQDRILEAGKGVSIFLARKFISEYNLGRKVTLSSDETIIAFPFGYMTKGFKINWTRGIKAQNYIITIESNDHQNPFNRTINTNKRDFTLKNIEPGNYSVSINYENYFGTWSLGSNRIDFTIQEPSFADVGFANSEPILKFEPYKSGMLIGGSVPKSYSENFLPLLYSVTEKGMVLQPNAISRIYSSGYLELFSETNSSQYLLFIVKKDDRDQYNATYPVLTDELKQKSSLFYTIDVNSDISK